MTDKPEEKKESQPSGEEKKYLLKIIVLGDSGVGKTSLLNVYVKDLFTMEYKATIGADFLTKQLQHGNELWQLQIWDTAGQEKHHALAQGFYRGTECCILVYDVGDRKSFTEMDGWKEEFLKKLNPPDPETFPFVLIANKVDLEEPKVTVEEGREYAATQKMPFFECSAKTGTGINEAFEKAAELAQARAAKDENVLLPNVTKVTLNTNQQKKKCCLSK